MNLAVTGISASWVFSSGPMIVLPVLFQVWLVLDSLVRTEAPREQRGSLVDLDVTEAPWSIAEWAVALRFDLTIRKPLY